MPPTRLDFSRAHSLPYQQPNLLAHRCFDPHAPSCPRALSLKSHSPWAGRSFFIIIVNLKLSVFGNMANSDGLQSFDFDPRNAHYQYSSRLSWPLQQHTGATSASSAAMISKRSTSPLPLSLEAQSYHQTANYSPAAVITDWQVTSQPAPVSFALDTTRFTQQTFDTYGTPFQTSPTDYITQQTGLEAANMDPNMNAGLLLDASSYASSSNAMANMNDMNQLQMNWAELDTNLYGYPAEMIHPQQPLQMGSPSETYISDSHDLRSLSSSDNGWVSIESTHPQIGSIFNPQQALHPRSFSDSSCSDVEQHSHGSLDGYVEVSHSASSPSTDSAGDMNFPSDQEYPLDFERQSPPAPVTTALIKPIAIRQPNSTSPQRSPTSPVARRQPRKAPAIKSSSSSKIGGRRPSQVVKNETEKRVGRRKGPLRPDQRKQAMEIRKLGACIRCRFLKKTVR